MRGKLLCLILVHADETRSMIPVHWTDYMNMSNENTNKASLPTIATINDLIAMRQKVDFLLQRAITNQKEKVNAGGTNGSNGSHGTSDYRTTALESTGQ
jgi:hypothetical protein